MVTADEKAKQAVPRFTAEDAKALLRLVDNASVAEQRAAERAAVARHKYQEAIGTMTTEELRRLAKLVGKPVPKDGRSKESLLASLRHP